MQVTESRKALSIERYDRSTSESGHVQRLHQEDGCSALGLGPELKSTGEVLPRQVVDQPIASLVVRVVRGGHRRVGKAISERTDAEA